MSNDTIKDQSDGSFAVPAAGDYIDALRVIDPPSAHRAMLGRHHNAHNRCVTFSQLASAAGYEDFRAANLQYGTLGRRLGETLGMEFATYGDPPKPFFSSAIGCGNPYRPATNEFELLMHHELAHALDVLAVEGFFGGAARGKER